MSVEISPPDEDRKEFFEKSVKPLLIAAEDNNAIDKWMFALKDDGEVNTSSVVFVSAVEKMIFLTESFSETYQPPKPTPFILSDMEKNALSDLPKDVAERHIKNRKRQHQRMHRLIHGIHKETTVEIQLKDGSYETALETWSSRIRIYDLSDSRFIGKQVYIQGTNEIPKIEDFCQDLDIHNYP